MMMDEVTSFARYGFPDADWAPFTTDNECLRRYVSPSYGQEEENPDSSCGMASLVSDDLQARCHYMIHKHFQGDLMHP